MRFSFTFILVVLCITLSNCKKRNNNDQYYFNITINGQTIADTWNQGPGSEVSMGADLDPGIIAGVIRQKCEASGKTCYRFSFEIEENRKGDHDPVSLLFDIKNGSTTDMFHYYNANENGNMTIILENIQPPVGTTNFGGISGKFKGNLYLGFPAAGQAVLVPVEGNFLIPTIP